MAMMNTYEITNTSSGHSFGTFDADSEQGALEALAKDAGYKSYADMRKVAPGDDIRVSEALTKTQIVAIEAAAKRDAQLFVNEFDEGFDPDISDWDGEAWGQETALADTGAKGFALYQKTLVEESARLAANVR